MWGGGSVRSGGGRGKELQGVLACTEARGVCGLLSASALAARVPRSASPACAVGPQSPTATPCYKRALPAPPRVASRCGVQSKNFARQGSKPAKRAANPNIRGSGPGGRVRGPGLLPLPRKPLLHQTVLPRARVYAVVLGGASASRLRGCAMAQRSGRAGTGCFRGPPPSSAAWNSLETRDLLMNCFCLVVCGLGVQAGS